MEHDGWARPDNAKQVKCLKHVASGKSLLVIGSPMALLGERVKPAFALVSRATRKKLSRSFSFIFFMRCQRSCLCHVRCRCARQQKPYLFSFSILRDCCTCYRSSRALPRMSILAVVMMSKASVGTAWLAKRWRPASTRRDQYIHGASHQRLRAHRRRHSSHSNENNKDGGEIAL